MSEPRNLTEADVEAILDGLSKRLKNEFYRDLGKGLWGIVVQAIVMTMVGIAAYQGLKGIK